MNSPAQSASAGGKDSRRRADERPAEGRDGGKTRRWRGWPLASSWTKRSEGGSSRRVERAVPPSRSRSPKLGSCLQSADGRGRLTFLPPSVAGPVSPSAESTPQGPARRAAVLPEFGLEPPPTPSVNAAPTVLPEFGLEPPPTPSVNAAPTFLPEFGLEPPLTPLADAATARPLEWPSFRERPRDSALLPPARGQLGHPGAAARFSPQEAILRPLCTLPEDRLQLLSPAERVNPYCCLLTNKTIVEGERAEAPVATLNIMKISGACLKSLVCGACERELPEGSFSEEQRARRQSSRRCEECVAAGNQLVLMTKGRTRSEGDDCPICQLPLPLDMKQSMFKPCCMKRVCDGCALATHKRGMRDCPFCRAPTQGEKSQALAMIRKRVAARDPMAIWNLGTKYFFGKYGLKKDVTRAVELYLHAAELGVKEAHYNLGVTYDEGTDVEKDMAKALRHYEAAATCGHVFARHNLGCKEYKDGNYDLALQHFLISAKLGQENSLNRVKALFMSGLATKADYAAALRGYQSAIEEMSSPDREEAAGGVLIGEGDELTTSQNRHAAMTDLAGRYVGAQQADVPLQPIQYNERAHQRSASAGKASSRQEPRGRTGERLAAGGVGLYLLPTGPRGPREDRADGLTRAVPPSRSRSLRWDLARNPRTEGGRPESLRLTSPPPSFRPGRAALLPIVPSTKGSEGGLS
ncbi:hypothetical protein THAOC_11345 [Thalassiosira oceanica]|uniref:RING-type domain-containing protein n=1 Tax=Thalassiosira oceanica TaxID=159749 RepID=K0SQE3_THAOC|nr:hypothetical protein THAOC_11345 [Thalassiosira oceanica]|eukprot:EJK67595.1 hypothetical protein THAOC_11345 [Thalassiosira oceanica]